MTSAYNDHHHNQYSNIIDKINVIEGNNSIMSSASNNNQM